MCAGLSARGSARSCCMLLSVSLVKQTLGYSPVCASTGAGVCAREDGGHVMRTGAALWRGIVGAQVVVVEACMFTKTDQGQACPAAMSQHAS